jgi:hypothetical protein
VGLPTGLVFTEGWCAASTVFRVNGGVSYDHSGKQAEYGPVLVRQRRLVPRRAFDRAQRFMRCEASVSTSPRMETISSISAWSATSGGEICTTGSPRSSARQMRPASKSRGERKPRKSVSHSSSLKVSRVLLVLDELEGVEEPGPAQVADDRQVEELRERLVKVVLLLGHMLDDPLARMISMFFSAIAP